MEASALLPLRWAGIIGHRAIIARLRRILADRRVPHALLFYGLEGIGKKLTAQRLAQALLCENYAPYDGGSAAAECALPCGVCESCRRFQAATHPDWQIIEPSGAKNKIIRIDAVREIISQAARVPQLSRRRAIIIDGADHLNEQAANSLLKTLEEPPGEAHFILIAERRSSLLSTILSRVAPIAFAPLSADEIAAALKLQDIPAAAAKKLAAIAGGSVGRALRLAVDGGLERRADALAIFSRLPHLETIEIFALGERLGSLPRPQLAEYFACLRGFFHDLARLSAGLPPLSADAADELEKFSSRWDATRLLAAERLAAEAQRRLLSSNVAARLAAEALLLALADGQMRAAAEI